MEDKTNYVVSKQTGEVVGTVKTSKQRKPPFFLILLSVLLLVAVAFAFREHDRAQKALDIAHGYQDLLKSAEDGATDDFKMREKLIGELQKAENAGFEPVIDTKMMILLLKAASLDQNNRINRAAELELLLSEIE